MSNFLIFKAAFNNSATPAIGTYTAEGATASFTQDVSLSPDYYLYNPNASITAVQWFVPTKETTDFEFVADILTDDQSLGGDRYFIIADSTGTTGLCMLSSSSITEWRFMNGDSTATSDPEYVGAIDPATSGGFGVFHQFRVRVRKLTASSSSVEVYVDGTLKLTATAGAALVTCAKIGFVGGVTGSPSTDSGIKNAYVYDLSGGELVDRGVLSEGFNRSISWMKSKFIPLSGTNALAGSIVPDTDNAYDFGSSSYKLRYIYADTAYVTNLNLASKTIDTDANDNMVYDGHIVDTIEEQGNGYIRYSNGLQICWRSISWQSACSAPWGPMYSTSTIYESYAKSFVEIPSLSASGCIIPGGAFSVICTAEGSATQTPNIFLCRQNAIADVRTCIVRYIAIGRWK